MIQFQCSLFGWYRTYIELPNDIYVIVFRYIQAQFCMQLVRILGKVAIIKLIVVFLFMYSWVLSQKDWNQLYAMIGPAWMSFQGATSWALTEYSLETIAAKNHWIFLPPLSIPTAFSQLIQNDYLHRRQKHPLDKLYLLL